MRFLKLNAVLILSLFVAGCAGGWDDQKIDPVPPRPHGNFWVVIVESPNRLKARPDVENILQGKYLREYVKTHCKVGPDGKTPEFRLYYDTQTVDRESPAIRSLFTKAVTDSKAKGIEPWLAFSDGRKVISKPFPTELEADGTPKAVSLLKQYGGD